MVPESVARELIVLPVGLSDSTLDVVLPAEARLGSGDTVERLRFVLQRDFTHRFAVTKDLRPIVDFFYTAVYSEITNCDSKLNFECPKRWAEPDPTDNVRIRKCSVCHEQVTFCTNSDELARLAAMGKCVAFFDYTDQCEFLGLPDSP
jgi:hypothetical protein